MTLSRKHVLIGYGTEGTFAQLVSAHSEQNIPHVVLDLNLVERSESATLVRTSVGFAVRIDQNEVCVPDPASIYYRGFLRLTESHPRFAFMKEFLGLLEAELERLGGDSLVLNRPNTADANFSKAIHVKRLKAVGFSVPETIVSNAPEEVRRRVVPNETWVSKGCSGVRSIAVPYEAAHDWELYRLTLCPSLFQQRIKGVDVRVHVVGRQFVAQEI